MANVTCETIATKLVIVVNVTIFVNNIIATYMTVDENNNRIIAYFKGKDYFTKDDLHTYFSDAGISITDEALRIRIHRLKKIGIIQGIARGIYTISRKPSYTPEPDNFIRNVNKLYLSVYNELDYCIWSTKGLHNLMIHIPVRSFYVFETEKDICEAAFYLLKDNGIKAFYQPKKDQIDKYILSEDESMIVRPIISRAPYKVIGKIRMASIEKILVDLYCDNEIYYIYGGSELKRIYENVLNNYTINFSKLLHYAERRKRDKDIKEFMISNFISLVKGILI